MGKSFVLVAGNIGVGKTSLTDRVGARLGWKTAFESVEDNPFLKDFYESMERWSFHLQVYFLGHRANQHRELAADPASSIADRCVYEDAHIFARVLHHLGNMSTSEYQAYKEVYALVSESLPRPDLLLYLKAPVPVLVDRIQNRGREMEKGIDGDYLSLLDQFYEEWLEHFDLCPVLTIHTENLNFVHRPEHLDTVVSAIKQKLAGREDIVFDSID
ncbi:MAG: deoxynucleoside kinase [Candidatus Eisenbacteria bacterium]|uniref:Deoxynucleoside kinase n=1 Tax=Eiseniibacteriota bacterium TaxID=2212470 RepID=A0A7Y2E8J7_UNCEI|nr:deoxynucleoside kinase [Candidatus Eisenbacteria bacterium]